MLRSYDSVGRIASHVPTIEYRTVRRGPVSLGREFVDPAPSFTNTLYESRSGEVGQNPGKPRQQVAQQMTGIYIFTPGLGMVVSGRSVPRSVPEAHRQVILFIRQGCIDRILAKELVL